MLDVNRIIKKIPIILLEIRSYGLVKTAIKTARYYLLRGFPKTFKEHGGLNYLNIPTARKFKVLFVIGRGMEEYESARYRVFNLQEYLGMIGIETEAICEADVSSSILRVKEFNIVVIFRSVKSHAIEMLITHAKSLGLPIIFDIDDYVFEPEIIDTINGVKKLNRLERMRYEEGVKGYRSTLLSSDYFTTTTKFLVEKAEKLGVKSFIISNGLNKLQVEKASAASAKFDSEKNPSVNPVIGYFSGTPTHQNDFSLVVPAMINILSKYPGVRMLICGFLDINAFPELLKFSDRIDKRPFISWQDLINIYNIADIHLSPLETGNPFCEAKSELKYFEGAILKKPIIASATGPFVSAIKNGVNGYIAFNRDDWERYLSMLIENPQHRKEIGENAYSHATDKYSPEPMSAHVRHVYSEIINDYRQRRAVSNKSLVLTFVIPPPSKGSGGHNKIFSVAAHLVRAGHFVRIYITEPSLDFLNSQQASNFIKKNFECDRFDVIIAEDKISSCDALIATHYSTAYTAWKFRSNAAKLFYFVQDYEPLFFPMGSDYLEAANTYTMGFHHISIGEWCARQLLANHNVKCDWIPFPINKNIFYKRNLLRSTERKLVIFFARPDMPRRCFELGREALESLCKIHPDVDIALFGSSWNLGSLGFQYKNLGILPLQALAELYSIAYAGLAFNTTNPSMVPYEMMACGCPVVDLDMPGKELIYGSKNNVMLVGISPEKISEGILQLILDPALRERLAVAGMGYVQSFPDDKEFSKRFEDILIENIDR